MTTRRKFIKYIIFGSTAIIISYPTIKFLTPYEKTIATILFEDLKGLKINEEDIRQFSRRAAKENPWQLNDIRRKFLSFYNSKILRKIPAPFNKEYKIWRDTIVGTFLLSTDFFLNKMDENKPITYSGKIWSPYNMPCYNPFSSLFYKLD